MKTLLRSCFMAKGGDNKDLALRNFQLLNEADLEFDQEEDRLIWHEIREFVLRHNHVPDQQALLAIFTQKKEHSARDRMNELSNIPALYGGDFHVWLESRADDRRTRTTIEILKNAGTIVSTGMEIQEGRTTRKIYGPIEAMKYVLDASHDIMAPTLGARLSGEVTRDGADFLKRYTRVESDPLAGVGQHTGVTQMDVALNGAKRYELWIHAAFTGGMKSTFALNWLYNQAIYYQRSGLLFSLEMPYEQCRNILYAMHSFHEKFKLIRYWLGIQKSIDGDVGLSYTDIRDGTLPANARRFLTEFVVPDFNGTRVDVNHHPESGDPYLLPDGRQMRADQWPRFEDGKNVYHDMPHPETYGKIHIEVPDPDKSDFTMADLRHRAEVIYGKDPFHSIFTDHVGLMAPRKWVSSTTDRLNEIIRDCKRMAMSFNRGQGMAVVALFQINREGYRAAMKRKEKTGVASYDLVHLSYANEAERCVVSSTYVTTKSGLRPVEDVQVGEFVWSASGWKKVLGKFDNGIRRVWAVRTSRGSVLEGTGSHRVRVVQDGHLGWKALRDLTPDDYLVSSLGGSRWPKSEAPLPVLGVGAGEKPRGQQGVPLGVPSKLTPELAYLLGAWDGDGRVHSGGLAWTGNRMESQVREALRHAFKATFNHDLPLMESPSRPGSFDLVKWSAPLKRWFEQVAGQRGMEVPECVLGGTEESVCSYLRGLFDTDGWVNRTNVIGLKMKEGSEPLLRQVQMLLTALGIDSHLSFRRAVLKETGKSYGSFTLRVVSQKGRRVFLEKVGFTEDPKANGVLDSLQFQGGDKQVFPVPETFLRVYRQVHPPDTPQVRFAGSFYNNPRKVQQTRLVPRGALGRLVQAAFEDGIDNEDTRFLASLLDLQAVTVAEVRNTGRDAPVWDLEVEGDHEYQTGPVLSHNSADVVTASWMDQDLAKANRVQFQCLKSRDQKPFEMLWSRVEWPGRRILTCWDTPVQSQPQGQGNDIDDLDGVI